MIIFKCGKSLCLVAAPENTVPVTAFSLLDSCSESENNIVCDIEKINIDQVNEAYEQILKSDDKYRFVIDMSSFK